MAVVAALLVGLLMAGGYWTLAMGPGRQVVSAPGSVVVEFTGTGDQLTDTFQVREGWQIQWEGSGSRFAFAITGDRDFGMVINQDEAASGVTSPVGGGTFRLEITAEGSWMIAIIQGD